MPDPPIAEAVRADLAARLADALDFRLVEVVPIAPGTVTTNRLFRLVAGDGRVVFAKLYYQDARRRLDREFEALVRLQSHGVERVPVPLLRCDEHQYAVYSFAPGSAVPAAAYTPEHAAEVGRFAADLSRLRQLPDEPLPTARGALVALADRTLAGLHAYLESHHAVLASPDAPPALRALQAELAPAAEIENLVVRALAGAGPAWRADLAPDQLRLTTGDAGPHNVLIDPDGRVTVVDLESAGWDHPLAFVTDFLAHDQSLDLSQEAAEAFRATYRAEAEPPDALWDELDRACALRHVFWCAIYLNAANPEVVDRRRFNNPAFDPDAYLSGQISKVRRRLAIARAAVDSLP